MFQDVHVPQRDSLNIFLQSLLNSLQEKESFIQKVFERCINTLSCLENKHLPFILHQFDDVNKLGFQERYVRFEKLIALFEDQILDQIDSQDQAEVTSAMYKDFMQRQMPKSDDPSQFFDVSRDYMLVRVQGEISPKTQAIFVLRENVYVCKCFNPDIAMPLFYTAEVTDRLIDDIDSCQRSQGTESKKILPQFIIAKVKNCRQAKGDTINVDLDEIMFTSLY